MINKMGCVENGVDRLTLLKKPRITLNISKTSRSKKSDLVFGVIHTLWMYPKLTDDPSEDFIPIA